MPASSYDYIQRRQASLNGDPADTDDPYGSSLYPAPPAPTQARTAAPVADDDNANFDQLSQQTNNQAESDDAVAQAQAAARDAAAAKAQAAQDKIDAYNTAQQNKIDAQQYKTAGVITQPTAVMGADGRVQIQQQPQTDLDGNPQYTPADLGNVADAYGNVTRQRRSSDGTITSTDPYALGNANLRLTSQSTIMGKPTGKNADQLPSKDVSDLGVDTSGVMKDAQGNVIKDAQGNPLPDIKVDPQAPLNDPDVQAGVDTEEQKIVQEAAKQRVADTVGAQAADATEAATAALAAHSDAKDDVSDAKVALISPQTDDLDKAQGNLTAAQAREQQLAKAANDAKIAAAAAKDTAKKAADDPLGYLQAQTAAADQPSPGAAQQPDTGTGTPAATPAPVPQPGSNSTGSPAQQAPTQPVAGAAPGGPSSPAPASQTSSGPAGVVAGSDGGAPTAAAAGPPDPTPKGTWGEWFKNLGQVIPAGLAKGAGQVTEGVGEAVDAVQAPSHLLDGVINAAVKPFMDPARYQAMVTAQQQPSLFTKEGQQVVGAADDVLSGPGRTPVGSSQVMKADPQYQNDFVTKALVGTAEMAPTMIAKPVMALVGYQSAVDDARAKGDSPLTAQAKGVVGAVTYAAVGSMAEHLPFLRAGVDNPTVLKILQAGGAKAATAAVLKEVAKAIPRTAAEGLGFNFGGEVSSGDNPYSLDPDKAAQHTSDAGQNVVSMLPFALLPGIGKAASLSKMSDAIDSQLAKINAARAMPLPDGTPPRPPVDRATFIASLIQQGQAQAFSKALAQTQKQHDAIDANTNLSPTQKLAQKNQIVNALPADLRPAVLAQLGAAMQAKAQMQSLTQGAAARVAAPDGDLAHMDDGKLADEHTDVSNRLKLKAEQDAANAPAPAFIPGPNGPIPNPDAGNVPTPKRQTDPTERIWPKATPEYQQKLGTEISRRAQAKQAQADVQPQLAAVTADLQQKSAAIAQMASTPEGVQALKALNEYNARQAPGAPKADAGTVQKASDLAPKTAGVNLQPHPVLEAYLPVSHAIEQLPNPDQQAVATAAIKLVNGRALNSSEQSLLFGDPTTGQPPAVEPSGQPFATSSNGRAVLTDAGLARLRSLIPAASDILPKSEQAQHEAQPPVEAKGSKRGQAPAAEPVAPKTLKNSEKNSAPDDNPVQAEPSPEFSGMDDETLRVTRDNLKAAISAARAKGGDVPPTAKQKLARIEAELDHRDRLPMGDAPESGTPAPAPGRKPTAPAVGDDVNYTFDHADQGTVTTHGEVTETGPDHYRVVDANDGVERKVPFSRITSHAVPETPEATAQAEQPGAVDGSTAQGIGGRDGAADPAGNGTKPAAAETVGPNGETEARSAKTKPAESETTEPAPELPGIDPKTIKPEHREAADLLAKAYAKLKPLFDALGLDPKAVFTPAIHGEKTIGLAIDANDPTKVQVDLARLAKNMANLSTPGKRALRMDAVLEEEAIHIAGEKILGDKSREVHRDIWRSLTPEQQGKVLAEYGGYLGKGDEKPDDALDAMRGREYIRMLVQLERSGRTTEWSNKLSGKTVEYLRKVVDYLRSVLKPGNKAAEDLARRIQNVLDRGTQGETARQSTMPADVALRDGESVPARYEVAELGDLKPSHRNGSPNPDYPAGLNERDYSQPDERAKNEGMISNFDPRRVVTDNPDAVNGPPIVDKSGLVLGGNRRTMLLSDPRAYAKYRPYLQANAARFGLDPEQLAGMHQPVLIRRVDAPQEQHPELIRRLNETPTGGIDTANDAVSAGKQLSAPVVKDVSTLFSSDPDKTPLQHLTSGDTKSIAQQLLDAGAIRPNDREKYVAANGNLTPEGARLVRGVLLGSVVPDPALMRQIADTPTGTKLLNGLGPIFTMKARGADIGPLQEAVALEADRQRQGIRNVADHQAQGALTGIGRPATTEGETLQSMLAGITGREARRAFTQLQNLVSPLEPGQQGLFGESNRRSIADLSDAELNKIVTGSKQITKAADDLQSAIAGAAVPADEPEINQAAYHVRNLAVAEAPQFLRDAAAAGAAHGLELMPDAEKTAVKEVASLRKKLVDKPGRIPSDLLRTTLISRATSPDEVTAQARQVVDRMIERGYQVYSPGGVPDITNRHFSTSRGYRDIAMKFVKAGDPIVRELQIIQPHMLEAKHELHGPDQSIYKQALSHPEGSPERAGLERQMVEAYDQAYQKDNQSSRTPSESRQTPSASGRANSQSPLSPTYPLSSLGSTATGRGGENSARFIGSSGPESATDLGLSAFRGSRAITSENTPGAGGTQPPIAGAAVRDTGTGNLFGTERSRETPPTAVDEAPMSHDVALRVYNTLALLRVKGEALRADQARHLERAEKTLGQSFIPGMDQTAGGRPAQPTPVETAQPARSLQPRGVQQSMFDTGRDQDRGQGLLFGSAVADHPDVEKPLAAYVDVLRQGELSFDKPIDYAREYETDTGRAMPADLVARAKEMEVKPGEADGARAPIDLFRDHLPIADRIAARFDNIPGQQPEDARQVARMALAKAAREYDPTRGVPFGGYAPRVVRNALRDSYRGQSRRAVEQPTLDRPVDDDPDVTGKDLVRANEPSAAQEVASNDAHAQLRGYVDRVSMAPEARNALRGLLAGKDQTDIAREMGVSTQHVSQIVGEGLDRLRRVFAEKGIVRSDLVGGSAVRDHTETPEFKRWFGDSKMVDADGKPAVYYHGSKVPGLDEFNVDRQVAHRRGVDRGPSGFYFGSKSMAESFSRDSADPTGAPRPGNVIPAHLSIKKPFDSSVKVDGPMWADFKKAFPEFKSSPLAAMDERQMQEGIKDGWANAHLLDGVFEHLNDDAPFGHRPDFETSVDRRKRWTAFLKAHGFDGYQVNHDTVAFDPTQIKSATRNRGTFDPNDARITHGAAIPDPEELPGSELVTPEDLKIEHEGDSWGDAAANFDPDEPSTWPFAPDKADALDGYKSELDGFDPKDPDTWDGFLPMSLNGEHGNVSELADDADAIAERLEGQEGVDPAVAEKARALAKEVRDQIEKTILPIAQRNADYAKGILDQARSKAEAYFKESDDPDVNLARTDIDQPDTWPQEWRDTYDQMRKDAGVSIKDPEDMTQEDYDDPRRQAINDAFDAKHKPLIDAAKERVAAREKTPEQGTLFGGAVAEKEEFAHDALGFKPFLRDDVIPKIQEVAALFRDTHDGMMQMWAPQFRGEAARKTAELLSTTLADIARTRDQTELAFRQARTLFDARPREANLDFIDDIENNRTIEDPQLREIAANMRAVNNMYVQLARSVPSKQFRGFIENYFPHIWKQSDQAKAEAFYRRKIEGSRAFLKHRSIPTVRDGIENAKLSLVSDNPVDLFLMRWAQMNKFVASQHMMEAMKAEGMAVPARDDAEAPVGSVRIDPKIGWSTEEVPDEKAIDENRRARENPELFPSNRKDRPETRQRFVPLYAPAEAAAVLNNYLSPGLRYDKHVGGAYRALTGASNFLNSAQLGFSAFHLGFTTYDTMVSKLGLGIEQAISGQGIAAVKSLASIPITPVTNLLQGDKMLKEWMRPGTQGEEIGKLVDAVVQGGGRAQQDPLYANRCLERTIQRWRQGNRVGAVMHAPFAAVDAVTKPIMEWLVPRQKLGVFADLARREMDKLGPNASQNDVRQAMQTAWASVDNRLGQLVYDNLHWNKFAKDAAMIAVRSVGWNLGTYRELGGGAIDYGKALANLAQGKKAEFTHRMAYATALPLMTMGMGSLINYLFTGESPKDMMDYFFPRTGETDVNGHPKRIALPSYMKDVFATAHDPGETLANKVNPALSVVLMMMRNHDYYGTQIYNPDDPLYKKAAEVLGFAGHQFLPFSFTGANQFATANPPPPDSKGIIPRLLGSAGTHAALRTAPFVGMVPAASWLSQSAAEKRAGELDDRLGGETLTSEQAANRKSYTDLRNFITQNDPAHPGLPPDEVDRRSKAVSQALQQAVKARVIKPTGIASILRSARETPLVRMFNNIAMENEQRRDPKAAYEQAKSIWELATADERKQLAIPFRKLWVSARTNRYTTDSDPTASGAH